MRLLETIFLILSLILPIWLLKRNAVKSFVLTILSGCTLLVFLLHLIIEGWRWQMVPAYLAGAVILIVFAVKKFIRRDADDQPRKWFRTALKILFPGTAILLVMISGVLSWALPVFKLPIPTGPYQVGSSQWYLMDKSRAETFTDKPDDYREISVWSWYPANVSGKPIRAEYLKNRRLTGKAVLSDSHASTILGLNWLSGAAGAILFDYLRLVRTHSYQDAAVSQRQSPYPVLIFSHGYGAIAIQNTALMEELASNGYVVFSIGHTYESNVELFPDSRQIRFSPKNELDMTISNVGKSAEKIKTDDLEASIALMKNFNTSKGWGESTKIWLSDTKFVINWLEKMNTVDSTGAFYGRLDMNKLGVFGMSFGGYIAFQLFFEDDRLKAAINLDGGALLGDFFDRPLNKPYMYLSSDPTMPLGKLTQTVFEYIKKKADASAYSVTVKGSKHLNFTDVSAWSPVLKHTDAFGKIDGDKMLKIMNAYTVAFFDKHLKGIDSPLLKGPSSDFPEVIFKAKDN